MIDLLFVGFLLTSISFGCCAYRGDYSGKRRQRKMLQQFLQQQKVGCRGLMKAKRYKVLRLIKHGNQIIPLVAVPKSQSHQQIQFHNGSHLFGRPGLFGNIFPCTKGLFASDSAESSFESSTVDSSCNSSNSNYSTSSTLSSITNSCQSHSQSTKTDSKCYSICSNNSSSLSVKAKSSSSGSSTSMVSSTSSTSGSSTCTEQSSKECPRSYVNEERNAATTLKTINYIPNRTKKSKSKSMDRLSKTSSLLLLEPQNPRMISKQDFSNSSMEFLLNSAGFQNSYSSSCPVSPHFSFSESSCSSPSSSSSSSSSNGSEDRKKDLKSKKRKDKYKNSAKTKIKKLLFMKGNKPRKLPKAQIVCEKFVSHPSLLYKSNKESQHIDRSISKNTTNIIEDDSSRKSQATFSNTGEDFSEKYYLEQKQKSELMNVRAISDYYNLPSKK